MKRILPALLISMLLTACQTQRPGNEVPQTRPGKMTKTGPEVFSPVSLTDFPEWVARGNKRKGVEILDIYKPVNEIPADADESLCTYRYFEEQGFETTDWGRGNWPGGPRIVSLTVEKDSTRIRLDKLYHSIPGENNYRVTERVKYVN